MIGYPIINAIDGDDMSFDELGDEISERAVQGMETEYDNNRTGNPHMP